VIPRTAFLIAIALWLLPVSTATQEPPVLVSPEVRPDRSVVFRLSAPKAIEVQLSGDWMTGPPVPLAKDGSGIWTAIQGPLDPNIYGYSLIVDGVWADDPMCRCTIGFTGGRGASSRFLIAAQPPAVWENRDKPAGSLHHERFYSRSQQRMRGVIVYTPPSFDPKAARRYPVLVLLSGSPGDETEWTNGGADIVFDNLIAQGKMMPSIVVMHASDVDPKTPTRRGD
jgi:enterochelin esterase family protein